MTMKERCLRAMEYHEKGLNCGQSVLLAFADITGFSEEQSMALASGFGGGLRCGGVCGVVNAAAVVLGMVYPATLEKRRGREEALLGADKGLPAGATQRGSTSWTAATCWRRRTWTPRTWPGSWA